MTYFPFLFDLLYLSIVALVIYVLYLNIDGWINRPINVRGEQNVLIEKLIDVLERNKPRRS
ncbi:hypothetical protein GCM10023231_17120 [Olivibacter ginsenosidimutans]|uniref:Uncharacterized protein n=1 Tax=Olivibacter ginsenosidimutans TaxID=1176537 RepID=A0ABP9B5A2_9SPHI